MSKNRGGSRRKGGGHGGRFPPVNRKKKSKGKSNNHRGGISVNTNFPELMDLEDNVVVDRGNKMKNLAYRPGRLMDEVEFTYSHQEDTFKKSLRNRPIEFVKAKEVYDPNKELMKGVKESKIPKENQELLDLLTSSKPDEELFQLTNDSLLSEDDDDDEETEEAEEIEGEEIGEGEIERGEEEGVEEERLEEVIEDIEVDETEEEVNNEPFENNEPNELEFIIDVNGDEDFIERMSTASILEDMDKYSTNKESKIDYESEITIGKVSYNTLINDKGETVIELYSNPKKKKNRTKLRSMPDVEFSGISDDDMGAYKDYISQIMSKIQKDDSDDSYESETNFDIMASSSEDESGEASEQEETNVNKDPEYGYLPEDYAFDISQISVENVRFGIENQYYTKCSELTGSDDTYMWTEESDFFDYVLSKGVPEHRLESFLRYITNGLIDQKVEEQPDYSDVYISETSEEESSDRDDDLEDLVSFTKSQMKSFTFDELPPTKTTRTLGKGKNKQLDLQNIDMDDDIRQSIQEHYMVQRKSKKDKKDRKEKAKLDNGFNKHDLMILYPFSIHIKEIKLEFDTFLHDTDRDTMNFPPLDPHGNKTIIKMANCFNMRSSKCGKGLKQSVKVAKHRKTFHYLPNYNQVAAMLRQRPIFNRTDQKRTRDEISQTDGNTKKDKERGRNNSSSKAHAKEGDIVGADAPEIGKNNIGRQLLEKLGWVQGEGLGVEGNKGISEPVVAKVKNSKTGLK